MHNHPPLSEPQVDGQKGTKQHSWFNRLYQVIYWALPFLILYIVLRQIDLYALQSNVGKTNPWLLALGLLSYPLAVLLGALRWHFLIAQFLKCKIEIGFSLKHYWIGLALGVFAPGSIGWDTYRVVISGKRFGQYGLNAAVIIAEKLIAMASCLILILAVSPFLQINILASMGAVFWNLAALLLVMAVGVIVAVLTLRSRHFSVLIAKVKTYLLSLTHKLYSTPGMSTETSLIPFQATAVPLRNWRCFVLALILSLGIQAATALSNYLFFRALGYDLPISVNLFVGPVLTFVFLLPISFGSLGIRESAYIITYGWFGVPAESALLVSFFNLMGLLFNNLIGGLLMLSNAATKTALEDKDDPKRYL